MNPIKRTTKVVGDVAPASEEAPLDYNEGSIMDRVSAFIRKVLWLTASTVTTVFITVATLNPSLLLMYSSMEAMSVRKWSREEINDEIEMVAKKEGIPSELLSAIVSAESNFQVDAMRFEPAVFDRMKSVSQEQRTAMASSHGLAQVMGYHAQKTCGLKSWTQLMKPAENLKCAVTILNANLRDSNGDVWTAVRMYNGSGPRAEKYADKILASFTNLVVRDAQNAHIELVSAAKRKEATPNEAKIRQQLAKNS